MAFCFMFVLCFIDMLCPGLRGTIKAAKQSGTRPERAFRPPIEFSSQLSLPTPANFSDRRIQPEIPYEAVCLGMRGGAWKKVSLLRRKQIRVQV